MKACPSCRQHVFHPETRCPFCATPLQEIGAPRAAMALGIAATLAACGPQVALESASAGSMSESSGEPVASTTMGSTESTTSASTTSTTSTTTAADSTGTMDSTSIGSVGTVFITEPDGGGPVYGSPCDTWQNDCGNGDKCMPWSNTGEPRWSDFRCSPIAARPGLVGDGCSVEGSAFSGIDDCDEGLMCFQVDPDTLQGTCVAMCEGSEASPSCADPDQVCSQTHEGVLNLCLQPCDPVAQDCPDGLSCTANDVEFVCVRAGDGGLGQECFPLIGCGPALSCVVDATPACASRCCTEACDPAMPACTDAELACQPLGAAGVCGAN